MHGTMGARVGKRATAAVAVSAVTLLSVLTGGCTGDGDEGADSPHLPVVLARTEAAGGTDRAVYTVSATARPSEGSNQQQLRLVVSSVSYTFDVVERQKRQITLRSGKSLTLTQLMQEVGGFLDSILRGAAPGTQTGKLGDVRFGGEARFVATEAGLRIDFVDQKGKTSETAALSKEEVKVFRALLTEAAGR